MGLFYASRPLRREFDAFHQYLDVLLCGDGRVAQV